MRYKKHLATWKKIAIYASILVVVVALNITLSCVSFDGSSENATSAIAYCIISCILETGGLVYFIIHDMISINKGIKSKTLDINPNKKLIVKFINRKELIQEIVCDVFECFNQNKYYYENNIKYEEHNGKYEFAIRLAQEFDRLRTGIGETFTKIEKRQTKKLGYVYFVDYSKYLQNFEEHVKGLYFIKGKKNIVIVNNYYNPYDYWNDDLADNDVFFVKLNYLNNAENKLAFADDKIVCLLEEMRQTTKYAGLLSGISDINALAIKLGELSGNNIGKLISIIESGELDTLVETDRLFVDFYLDIKNANYRDAQQKYNILKASQSIHGFYKYKFEYECANLQHFLGNYKPALDDLKILDSCLLADNNHNGTSLGQKLHYDIVLLEAHILKHLGDFEHAQIALANIAEQYHDNLLWLRSNFAIDIFRLNELEINSYEWKELLQQCLDKMEKFKQVRSENYQDSNYYFFETYYPVAKFYQNGFNKHQMGELLGTEERAIQYYKNNERRFLTNCLFIKAELLRINDELSDAKHFYESCYHIYCGNSDKDILYLVAITEKYIETFYKVELNIVKDRESILLQCLAEEDYKFHQRLLVKLNEASVDKDRFKALNDHFKKTITPIP